MIKRPCAALVLMVFATAVPAQGLDISLSDETANILYLTDSGSLGYGGADIGFGLFFNERDAYLGIAKVLVTSSSIGRRHFQFGVGAKGYVGELGDLDESVAGIAIGGLIRYIIPGRTPMALALEGYVAPSVTSFSDTESVQELMARFEIEIMPSTRAYIGYRFLEAELKDGREIELDDGAHVGIRVTF